MKEIKFPLKLKDDFPARSLDELKCHFDFEKIVEYFVEGKLLNWRKVEAVVKDYTGYDFAGVSLSNINLDAQSMFLIG